MPGYPGRQTDDPAVSATAQSTAGALLLVALAAALWGTVGPASKALYGLTDITPLTVGFLRLATAAPMLLLLSLLVAGRRSLVFRRRDLLLILLLGIAMALYQVFYFTAVANAGVAIATLVTICTAPLLVAVLSTVTLGERITPRIGAALAVGIGGTGLLIGFPENVGAEHSVVLTGVAWAVGAAICYAVFTLCSRALAPGHHPFALIAIGFGAGALILLPFAGAAGRPDLSSTPALSLVLYIGLVPTALAYVFYFRGMRGTTATAASVITLMEPLTATVLAWLLFGERLGAVGFLGALLLLASIVLLSHARPGHRGAVGAPGR